MQRSAYVLPALKNRKVQYFLGIPVRTASLKSRIPKLTQIKYSFQPRNCSFHATSIDRSPLDVPARVSPCPEYLEIAPSFCERLVKDS